MNLIIKTIPVILLYECQTNVTAVFERSKNDHAKLGKWINYEMGRIGMFCFHRHLVPDIRVVPTKVTRKELDALEVEEVVFHAQLPSV